VLVSGDRDLPVLAAARGLCPTLAIDTICRQYLGE
jgi:hypothetical protein